MKKTRRKFNLTTVILAISSIFLFVSAFVFYKRLEESLTEKALNQNRGLVIDLEKETVISGSLYSHDTKAVFNNHLPPKDHIKQEGSVNNQNVTIDDKQEETIEQTP
jgi:hypothetical protein